MIRLEFLKYSVQEWQQMGRLIKNGLSRNQVAIIYDVGVSTLYRKFPASELMKDQEDYEADQVYFDEKTEWEQAIEISPPDSI